LNVQDAALATRLKDLRADAYGTLADEIDRAVEALS